MIETKSRTDAPRPIDRSHMDPTARPCDDFYQYANGTWLANTKIPDDEAGWGGFAELRDRNFDVLHGILDEAATGGTGSGKLVGDLYASGMDEAAIERLRALPVEPRNVVILTVRVVIAPLRAQRFVTREQHRRAERHQHGGDQRARDPLARGENRGIVGRTLDAPVAAAILVVTVVVALAIRFVVLVLVRRHIC